MEYKCQFVNAISILVVVMGCAACRQSDEQTSTAEPTITFANVPDERASYAGDATCSSCHASEYAGFQEHGMANSIHLVRDSARTEEFDSEPIYHTGTDFYYRAYRADSGLYQEEYRLDTGGRKIHSLTKRMDYAVGSGGAALTYLTDENGRLYELPLTWYSQQGRWDFSPGYEESNLRFSRLVPDRCMACHNNYPDDVPDLEGKYINVPEGIGCERCHGPGSIHVEARLGDPDGAGPIDTTIVNPEHLDLTRRLDVCQQCHLNGSVDVLRQGRGAFSFQPSELLSDHQAMFISSHLQGAGIEVISHADRMKQSECFLETINTSQPLECTTCHNPHEGFRDKGFEYFTATCLSCHDAQSLTAGRDVGFASDHDPAANCISCHMPKRAAEDVPHASFTDHFIRVIDDPDDARASGVPAAITSRETAMTPLFERDAGTVEGDIYRGMALITMGRQQADLDAIRRGTALIESREDAAAENPESQFLLGLGYLFLNEVDRAIEPLEAAVTKQADDPEVLNALAQAYESDGRSAAVIERLYNRALSIQPQAADIRLNYGRFLLSVGRTQAAAGEFENVISERPAYSEGYYNLGTAQLQLGLQNESLQNLHRALHYDPDNQEALGNLGFLHASTGNSDSALVYFQRALAVDVNSAVALANLGAFHLNSGDQAAAIDVLQRAVGIDPDFADALANLSLAYFQTDRVEESRRFAERAIAVSPNHALARQILDAL